MQKIIISLVCIISVTPLFSQDYYNELLAQTTDWDTIRIKNVLSERLLILPNSIKERYSSLISYANENYDLTVVFHVEMTYKDSVINISIADNVFPMDLFYVTTSRCGRCNVKLIVWTYKGDVEIVDNRFRTMVKGLAKKEAKAFRYINKQHPDLIFLCHDFFGCFFYLKNGEVYIYDYLNQEKGPLKEYRVLTERLKKGHY